MLGFLGYLGAIGLSLTTDKSRYQTGDQPVYSIVGGVPGSQVAWTSYKNGQSTGEYNANYGQTIDANGTAQLTGGAWTDAEAGNWQKQVLVIAPNGALSNAEVSFSVGPKATAINPIAPAGGGGFLDGSITLPIVGSVSKPVAYLGIAGLAYFLFSGRGRR
ncbi:MAG: hypothetical protein KGJ13_05695 [Patescibacteria group bacterium]|nr:hypothetical protein [Patescibacteria group bacterium]